MEPSHRAAHDSDVYRQTLARDKIQERRRAALERAGEPSEIHIGEDWYDLANADYRDKYITRDETVGLALSGGGIRSATISLGLIEALASRGRFYGIDMISTVSGGGYIGSFLRSLFVAREGEDHAKGPIHDRIDFADATLTSLPDQQYFHGQGGHSPFVHGKKTIKNPLWWLRENGRYLAPGGMSGYGYALTAIVRNWTTLIVYLLAIFMLGFACLQLALVGLHQILSIAEPTRTGKIMTFLGSSGLLTPLAPLLLLTLLIGVSLIASFWMLLPLPFPTSGDEKARAAAMSKLRTGLIGAILIATIIGGSLYFDLWAKDSVARVWAAGLTIAFSIMAIAALGALVIMGQGVADIRRFHTQWHTGFNAFLLILVGLTLIDWAALKLRIVTDASEALVPAGFVTGTIASVAAFLIAKIPGWIGEGSGVRRMIMRNWRFVAFAGASIILGSIALFADLLVLKLLWRGEAWHVDSVRDWLVFVPVLGLILILTFLLSISPKFPNLLALTPFYGSRLTRAYLGASNVDRLDTDNPAGVTEGVIGDDLSLDRYMQDGGPAPLHFINVTRNRTVGEAIREAQIMVVDDDPFIREDPDDPRGRLASYESSLTLHDRQGDRMVFGPFGVRIGAEFIKLDDIVDPPSLGLLCAISGAAVGSGMGRLTSIGTAMAATLANARIGYWWKEQHKHGAAAVSHGWLPGLSCLYKELLGRFGTEKHWFLSDGGHSENSGVLALLERGCRFIIAADNAQDVDYSFGDLEILIRTARTDIGMEVRIAEPGQFPASLKPVADCFFNGKPGDWRAAAKQTGSEAFALLLKATDIPRRVDGGRWKSRKSGTSYIVWIKPRCFDGLPADIATYAELNPDFPQQSTSNQFFGEAQWESYRRLGFEMGRLLAPDRAALADFLPVIFLKAKSQSPVQPSGGN